MIKLVAPKLLGKDVLAMSVGPFIILKDEQLRNDKILINHETIHWRQALELLIIGFWILYFAFYLKNRMNLISDEAYRAIPFEKEAYANEADLNYLSKRKLYSWIKFT
jgi:hypothetical protein